MGNRTVVAYAPDGTEVSWDTSAGYDVAGLLQYRNGSWAKVQHGFSPGAVRKRTITSYGRSADAIGHTVVTIWEATAPVIRAYFGHHRAGISSVFTPEAGWVTVSEAGYVTKGQLSASRAVLRKLARDGISAIAVQAGHRIADFQMEEVTRSLKTPGHRCATVGHRARPAEYKVSYNYRGEEETTTEYVCGDCKESYGRRPVLKNFTAAKLGG